MTTWVDRLRANYDIKDDDARPDKTADPADDDDEDDNDNDYDDEDQRTRTKA